MTRTDTHLVIIGGSDAGISAALGARELDSDARISVVVADRFPNYSICGLPFFLSGEVVDFKHLAHRTADDIEKEGIDLLLEQRATSIDASAHRVDLVSASGESSALTYDTLIIGTGGASLRPPLKGASLAGVFFLRWMQDGFAISSWLQKRKPASALVVGGGYIGMEMADALKRRGMSVTVVEFGSSLLQTVDPVLGELVRAELTGKGVEVTTGIGVESISEEGEELLVTGSNGFQKVFELVIVATGVTPETALARTAGIKTGERGAIRVDRAMATGTADIYAAGDCTETYHRLLGRNAYLPLGSTAHKQGRVAGENAVGGSAEFEGTLGTQVVKVFDLVVARTGLRDDEARAGKHDPLSVDCETWDHKVYYPGATRMWVRMTGDRQSGRLLGAQIVGHHGAEISKRIDVVAAALFNGMRVEQLADIDLSYTPPLSSPWDPVQMAAQAWSLTRGRG